MAIPSIAVNAGVLAGAHLQDLHTKINFFTGDQGALFTGLFVPPVSPPSHINWNLTAPLGPDIPGQFPTYGNYGGLNYTGGKIGGNDFSIPALDPLDNAFRTHDQKYADAESLTGEPFVTRAMVIADRDLLTQISQIRPEELNADGHLYAALVTVAFVQKINLSANFFSAEEQQAYGLDPGDLTQYLNFAADQVALSSDGLLGRHMDAYLSGATVFADADAKGHLGETSTTTDATGHFNALDHVGQTQAGDQLLADTAAVELPAQGAG